MTLPMNQRNVDVPLKKGRCIGDFMGRVIESNGYNE